MMIRKDLERALRLQVLAIYGSDRYFLMDDYACAVDLNEDIRWIFYITLSESAPLYSVSARIACEYKNASRAIKEFVRENGVMAEDLPNVAFGAALERYTTESSVLRVSEKNLTEIAKELCVRIKEGEANYLLPRFDQKFVVDEYLKKPPHKWPTADLLQCCLTVVSYGLLNDSPSVVKAGIARVFEILQKPNYNQLHKEFFESLKKAVEKKYGPIESV